MHKKMTPEQVYDSLVSKGMYEEANLDLDEVSKVIEMTKEDYECAKEIHNQKKPS